MISLRSFRGLPSRSLGVIICTWLCAAGASMAQFPVPAQAQTPPPTVPGQPPPQTQKATTRVDATASSSTSEAGNAVTFEAAVAGTGGTPTGIVTFKDGENVLGSVALSEGRARLTTAGRPVGQRTIVVTYSGDDNFEGSVSAVLPHEVVKATPTVALTASSSTSEAGNPVTFEAAVTGTGGTPTGIVSFKYGENVLGSVALSEERARLTTAGLSIGQHTVTATYGGDATFRESISRPLPYLVSKPTSLVGKSPTDRQQDTAGALLFLAAIVLAALFVVFRRIVFRRLFRPLVRSVRTLFRSGRKLLRIGGRATARQRPAESIVGMGIGAFAEGFTETEDAIADGFDTSTVTIERNARFVCSWIQPKYSSQEVYDRDRAQEDFKNASQLFAFRVPLHSNPLNVYDDINNAFIVDLFKGSDRPCFHILSEFRKTISDNVVALVLTYTLIVTAALFFNIVNINATPPTPPIDFYGRLGGLVELLPKSWGVPFLDVKLDTAAQFNWFMFALVSCIAGYAAMWLFYNLFYEQSQTHNGVQMHTFLRDYLAEITNHFNKIIAPAGQAVIREGAEEVTRETLMWITDLYWMSIRRQFIMQFLRNILFQIRRNSAFALLLIPLGFVFLLCGGFYLLGRSDKLFLHNYWFYPLFLLLLYTYGRYLKRALSPISKAINEGEYRRLELVEAMTEIMTAYARQLDQFRTRFSRPGQGPGQGPGGAA